mmetsp:Transcript_50610/g.147135  ORF Transcript_50610/g.147135 Transcript_50610/m.147135 type:complete len:231 (-) Transcript_50610:92-784(-)
MPLGAHHRLREGLLPGAEVEGRASGALPARAVAQEGVLRSIHGAASVLWTGQEGVAAHVRELARRRRQRIPCGHTARRPRCARRHPGGRLHLRRRPVRVDWRGAARTRMREEGVVADVHRTLGITGNHNVVPVVLDLLVGVLAPVAGLDLLEASPHAILGVKSEFLPRREGRGTGEHRPLRRRRRRRARSGLARRSGEGGRVEAGRRADMEAELLLVRVLASEGRTLEVR